MIDSKLNKHIRNIRVYYKVVAYIICVVVLILVTRLVVLQRCNQQTCSAIQVRTCNQQTVFAIKDTELDFSVSQSICTVFITTVHTRNKLQSVDWTVYCGLQHQFVDCMHCFCHVTVLWFIITNSIHIYHNSK